MAERNSSRRKSNIPNYMDYTLLFIVIFLLGFGLVMVYSTSSYSVKLQFDGDAA